MHIIRNVFFVLSTVICCSKLAQSQELPKNGDPFVISVVTDSLFKNYDYSQVVSFSYTAGYNQDADKCVDRLTKKIVEKCKDDKWDGFLLQHTTFAPFGTKDVVAWGTLLRRKHK